MEERKKYDEIIDAKIKDINKNNNKEIEDLEKKDINKESSIEQINQKLNETNINNELLNQEPKGNLIGGVNYIS